MIADQSAAVQFLEDPANHGGQPVERIDIVADAVYVKLRERENLEGLALRLDIPFRGLWLSAPADKLTERVEQRTGDASDATEAVVRRQLECDTGTIRWHRLEASGTKQQVLKAAKVVLEL